MKPVLTINVHSRLPKRLEALRRIAGNFWWDWNYSAIDLFRRIEPELWDEGSHNPLHTLRHCSQERLDLLTKDDGFLKHLDQVEAQLQEYLTEPRWFQATYPEHKASLIAYFSAEFGLAQCMQSYSGGLGILSGDHLKTASDLGLPLVGVSLAYRKGYFHQYLNIDGWQQERHDLLDFNSLPIHQVDGIDGGPLTVAIPFLDAELQIAVFRIDVGRIPLYLLSTNLDANPPDERGITDDLYGGDAETRIRQEIVLGLGGVKALSALGLKPTAFHMNEGHSAFQPFARIAQLFSESDLAYAEARELVQGSTCFTTHTPLAAGNDMFAEDLIEKYFGQLPEQLGLTWADFMEAGSRGCPANSGSFCMTVAAIQHAAYINGVSRLHARVSRGMWQKIWEGIPEDEIPIRAITNGIHLYSWLCNDLATIFDRYVGPDWRSTPQNAELWKRLAEIPDDELWHVHQSRRTRLVAFARRALARQVTGRGAARPEIEGAADVLDPAALTIGFARRFATYKRAGLIFMDLQRLRQLVGDAERPVQFIFAGKAHPRDDAGKAVIKEVIHHIRGSGLRQHIVFLEDYDIQIARYLVQGCDIWLNTPRRPLEASGTSGMKAVANGALHMSVLDGWWDEAYLPDCGWAIGSGEEYADPDQQDRIECSALYNLIEQDAAEMFYNRSTGGLPRHWIAMMKRSMAAYIPRFSSHRMLTEYIENFYLPASINFQRLSADACRGARELAAWRRKIAENWKNISVKAVSASESSGLQVGDVIEVAADIQLGALASSDVTVELKTGMLNSLGELAHGNYVPMSPVDGLDRGVQCFVASVPIEHSGQIGVTVRILPHHALLPHKYAVFRAKWPA